MRAAHGCVDGSVGGVTEVSGAGAGDVVVVVVATGCRGGSTRIPVEMSTAQVLMVQAATASAELFAA